MCKPLWKQDKREQLIPREVGGVWNTVAFQKEGGPGIIATY